MGYLASIEWGDSNISSCSNFANDIGHAIEWLLSKRDNYKGYEAAESYKFRVYGFPSFEEKKLIIELGVLQ